MRIFLLLIIILSGCSSDSILSEKITDEGLSITLQFTGGGMVNRYTSKHQIVFPNKSYGVYPHNKIKVIDYILNKLMLG